MAHNLDMNPIDNLRRWRQSGQPRRWVEAHNGVWNHDDWLTLLSELVRSEYWPLQPEAVGATLEDARQRWQNLGRWQASGEPGRWIAQRQGRWGHAEWLRLLADLEQRFGPLDAEAVGHVVERSKREWEYLRRWQQSGRPRAWVEAHRGEWGHDDWLALLAELRAAGFGMLPPDAVGAALEEARLHWRNLGRWLESGEPRRWIKAHRGRWTNAEVRALVDTQQAAFGPLDPDAVIAALEKLRSEWAIFQVWQEVETEIPVIEAPPAPAVPVLRLRPAPVERPASVERPAPLSRTLFQAAWERARQHLQAA